ncbi:hypothetical protein C8F04DRAFT_1130605 [Mycena alexandri]|uniref:F-box domain-containing protein n=1 Tax=Mycena alexandri TaxID=1745969 RepID=A0AAD6SCN0_9AGAR|nr:hypothetical protein C8F04DRAFT_1130605 [Mycena alexandri]
MNENILPCASESIPCPRCGFPELVPRTVVDIVDPVSASPQYLRSNYLPPDSIIVDARREMATAETGIALVEEKISDMKRALDQLHQRRQSLRDFIADHRRVIAPIRRLPTELLAKIFSHCVEGRAYDWDPATNVEWILVQVSRAWRAVSISTPQIWSRIRMTSASTPENIERSAHFPLTIDFDFELSWEKQRRPVLAALLSARDRWQDVYIRLDDFLLFRSTTFPKLMKLSLLIDYSELHFNSGRAKIVLMQMRSISLSQLQKLVLSNTYDRSADLSSIFELTFNILHLRLRRCNSSLDDQESSPKTLPNLVSLDFSGCDDALLGYIIAPVLRQLTISLDGTGISDDFVSFMTRTGHSLTDLTLRAPANEALLEILTLTPQLTSLSLALWMSTPSPFNSAFVENLTCGPGERNLVPKVVTLELRGKFGCEGDDLLGMLASRCISGPLRLARIGGFRRLADIQEQLLALGLNLVDLLLELD